MVPQSGPESSNGGWFFRGPEKKHPQRCPEVTTLGAKVQSESPKRCWRGVERHCWAPQSGARGPQWHPKVDRIAPVGGWFSEARKKPPPEVPRGDHFRSKSSYSEPQKVMAGGGGGRCGDCGDGMVPGLQRIVVRGGKGSHIQGTRGVKTPGGKGSTFQGTRGATFKGPGG